MRPSKVAITGLPVQLLLSPGAVLMPLRMDLAYDPGDPYAVRVLFTYPDTRRTVEWIMGRDLLAAGMAEPAGEGDVRIWPARTAARDAVHIRLSGLTGTALFEAPAEEIAAFLRATEAVVPSGTESRHLDMGALLTHLLAEG
ncbi:sporulation and cell division protein SsgA [Streptomyces sp. BK022]|uniref:SsgA family sporulation/cell division regulator n=1 Tax=Streptomyces sp. BK022 TaxID=2512123 RepID=UPI0010E12E39|nr:SsgA family sporulation/cell division regulator [Streptomyces sp. BK022]RZU46026.1 sporulation and cell division protein SsgA [Streptomyces sp. BK022]